MRTLSLAGLMLMVAGIAGLFYERALFSPAPLAIAVQAAAIALMIWARITFGRRSFHAAADPTSGGLVTTGPYHFIRHPIYTAATLFCWAGALASPSLKSIGCAVLVLIGGLLRMRSEETLVVQRYPEYREYAQRTKRMLPYVF